MAEEEERKAEQAAPPTTKPPWLLEPPPWYPRASPADQRDTDIQLHLSWPHGHCRNRPPHDILQVHSPQPCMSRHCKQQPTGGPLVGMDIAKPPDAFSYIEFTRRNGVGDEA
jgi:hypothetical protein